MKQSKQQSKPTYCDNCGGRTGFGFGVEPLRYDTCVCTSKCAQELFNKTNRRQNEISWYGSKESTTHLKMYDS